MEEEAVKGIAGVPMVASWWNARSSVFFIMANWVELSKLRSVPRRIGLFKKHHAAKCVLCSWIVRLPLPISIMSMSLWEKKLTEDKWAEFVAIMLVMYDQVALASPAILQECPTLAPHSQTFA